MKSKLLDLLTLCYSHTSVYRRGEIDLEAKFEPNLLNTAIYLLSLSQQVSTFAINFQVCYSTQEWLWLAKYAVTGTSIPWGYKRESDTLLRPRWCQRCCILRGYWPRSRTQSLVTDCCVLTSAEKDGWNHWNVEWQDCPSFPRTYGKQFSIPCLPLPTQRGRRGGVDFQVTITLLTVLLSLPSALSGFLKSFSLAHNAQKNSIHLGARVHKLPN